MSVRSGKLGYSIIGLIAVLFILITYDLLFTKPDHLNGIVVEKIYVPARSVTGATPYGGVKRGNYSITAQHDEQWIALVRMQNGDTVKVHCLPDHYKTRNVGDLIHFKKYEGKLLHIEYFAHNEEED